MEQNSEALMVTLQVIEALNSLNIPYVIGGSLASALHGTARATLDSDLVIDIHPTQVASLVQALQDSFYVDEQAIHQAIRHQSSVNLIHWQTVFKVDLFVAGDMPFTHQQLQNAKTITLEGNPTQTARFTSAEDTLLAKLRWYRLGGDSSERQWRDIEGIQAMQGSRLDWAYLEQTATELGVRDLLQRLK
jgi:hypothetical protein